ncbi:hypothetical protein Taro_009040, partial [Colocasia esculenta]|nr:hypothetical protein [Colocasia esculenta]
IPWSASLLVSRRCDALRHQLRRRPGLARPYRGALGGCDKDRCRDLVSRRDRLAVATCCLIASGFVSRRPSPSRWYRDGLWGRDSTCERLGCFVARCTEHCFRFVPDSVGFCGSRSEVEEDHVLPSRSPLFQRPRLTALDPNPLLNLP